LPISILIRRDGINHEVVLAVLPSSKEEALSIKEIAEAIGLDITTHTDWFRAERVLARVLRIQIKWGWVACDRRKKKDGRRLWCNAYWKTELARQDDDD
jgi:hypothetical protein